MINKKPIIASSLAIALLILGATGIATFDRSALAAVTLASFTATGGDGQVLIEWETASEINNIGFNLWRSTSETGSYAKLNDSLIPSQALGSVIGAHYYYTDSDVSNGATYYYKLESVATDGSSELYGPISATPGAQPTATPTVTPTSLWTATPPATATATATQTPTPYAGSITNVRMSDTPGGAEMARFPSGTSVVYVVFDYFDMQNREIRVRVYDYVGNVLFEQVKAYTGSGTESIEVSGPEGRAFPGGRYFTNLYRGLFPVKSIIWEVAATHYRVYLPVILKNYSTPAPCLDEYEPDDTWQQARLIEVNQVIQSHNFHTTDDRDYVRFVAEADSVYTIRTLNLSAGNDTVLTLYDTDGTTQLEYDDDDPYNPPASKIVWLCPTTGTYFVKVAPFGTQIGGCDKTYDLKITSAPASTSTPTVTNTPSPAPTPTLTPSPTWDRDPCEPNNSFSTAYPILSGETYFAYINPGSDLDYFRFDIQTLHPITAKLTIPDPENVTYGFDLYFYDGADYNRLVMKANLAGEETIIITHDPAQTGRYYVKVYSIQNRFDPSKSYELRVVFDIEPTPTPSPTSTSTSTPTPTDTPTPSPTPTVIG